MRRGTKRWVNIMALLAKLGDDPVFSAHQSFESSTGHNVSLLESAASVGGGWGSGYLAEFGFGGAGAEGADADAEALCLLGQGLGEDAVKGLSGGVGSHISDRLVGRG